MKKLIIAVLAAIVLTNVGISQTRVSPPQIDYSKYGSLSDQLRVYEKVQGRLDRMDQRRYRRFREEVRRDAAAARRRQQSTRIVRTSGGVRYQRSNCDAHYRHQQRRQRSWRDRRGFSR